MWYVFVQLPPGSESVVTVLVEAGPAFEPADSPGVAYLTTRGMMAGTRPRSAEDLGNELARLRAKVTPYLGPEWAGITIAVADRDWDPALRLAADVIRNPTYPANKVKEAARAAEEEKRDALANPPWLLNWHLLRLLAGENGHGRVLDQIPTAFSAVSPTDLRAFHVQRFRPSTTVVGIGAAAPFADLRDGVIRAFGDWAPGAPEVPRPGRAPDDPPGSLTLIVNQPGTEVMVGCQRSAPPLPAGDTYAYLVLLAILNRRLQGAALPAGPPRRPRLGYQGLKEVGWLRVTWQGSPGELGPRVRALFSELQRLRNVRVGVEEVAEARQHVTQNLDAMGVTGRDLVWHLAGRELFELGGRPLREYRELLATVTPEKLLALAQEWLDPGRSAMVFMGDASQVAVPF